MSTSATNRQFRLLPPDRPHAELEEELLARWREEDLFRRTLEANAGKPEFVFFEGPPTANGRPGIHHVFARTLKDLFCRHRAMSGYHVARKAGWDTHGLPVEIEVEKQLAKQLQEREGLSDEELRKRTGKQLIEEVGVEEFNRLCRESVFTYREEWERLSERIGYWLDYEHPYVTYTNEYVESVWWSLKTLYEKGLLERGHKILPYCGRCGTSLSSHELALGYKDVEDPSVYVALDLVEDGPDTPVTPAVDGPGGNASHVANVPRARMRRRILVWTTTPWTLVSNVALAVHPDLEYVELRKKTGAEWTIILAASRAAGVLGADWADRWDVVTTVQGSALVGKRYRRPLDWVSLGDGNHEIIVGETFVSAEDGSGVVHMAPAFGADDYAAGQRHGLAFVQPVNARGEFPEGMPLIGGKFAKDADAIIVEELKRRDVLWKAGKELHSYPHCWRCGTPLLYYARTSWFVKTTSFKDEMMARNAAVDWHPPEVGAGRFGEWLENNIDWAISRDRYWGTPLPVWQCDADASHVDVIGSYAELAEKVGELPAEFDPHKPFIDRYEWDCAACQAVSSEGPAAGRGPQAAGRMRRTPEVIDTWFDSGAMSFAQWHYPFENTDVVAKQFPADFIAEGVDQTRGWFYSLLAIATGLGDALPNNGGGKQVPPPSPSARGRDDSAASPYRAVVVNDLVLDANGVKMSKRLGNIVNPFDVIAKYGVDAARLYLVSSSQVWKPRKFDEAQIRETAGAFLITLKNIYSGIFAQYANFGWEPGDEDPPVAERAPLDRWILSRLTTVEDTANRALFEYDAFAAARAISTFVISDLSQWYVRLSRARFYDVTSADNRAAFATLHEVLAVVCRLIAPFSPFVSDWMHRELTGESVHLASYVRTTTGVRDDGLEAAMDHVRALASLGLNARQQVGINVRQPLARMVCVVPDSAQMAVADLAGLIASEVNVKQVEFAGSSDSLVTLEARANFRALGKRFGKRTPLAAEAVAGLSSDALRAFERGEPVGVMVDGEDHVLQAEDVTVVRRATGTLVVSEEAGRFAALDPSITPELRQEGIARELVSRIQRLRKESGFEVSDRIRLRIWGDEQAEGAARAHEGWIAGEVLAVQVTIGSGESPAEQRTNAAHAIDLDGVSAFVALTRES